jgi:hypothetical protein
VTSAHCWRVTGACGTAGGRKAAASPAATNADTDMVSSVSAANISPAVAMNAVVAMAGHPRMAGRRNTAGHGRLRRGSALDCPAMPAGRGAGATCRGNRSAAGRSRSPRAGLLCGQDAADAGGLLVAVPVQDRVQVVELGGRVIAGQLPFERGPRGARRGCRGPTSGPGPTVRSAWSLPPARGQHAQQPAREGALAPLRHGLHGRFRQGRGGQLSAGPGTEDGADLLIHDNTPVLAG